jgi:hypothetical protein
VMDIEIDDRHPGEPVDFARPQRADRGIVEQAKNPIARSGSA